MIGSRDAALRLSGDMKEALVQPAVWPCRPFVACSTHAQLLFTPFLF